MKEAPRSLLGNSRRVSRMILMLWILFFLIVGLIAVVALMSWRQTLPFS